MSGPLRLALGLVLMATVVGARPAGAQDAFANVERIVAVGDVHGGFEQLTKVLHDAGLIDERRRWTGGRTHLVQTGDVLDRGSDSRRVLDLLMDLERQATRAGGRVHALLGNHEVMNMIGDLRYVSSGEYEAFRTPESADLRNRAFEILADPARKGDRAYREQWDAEHPLGWVEHRQAFAPNGRYGKWLRERRAVVRVNDALFLHGGISPKYVDLSIAQINQHVRSELDKPELVPTGLAGDDEGPLWYRGLAQGDEAQLAAHVERLLTTHGVRHVVVGHTILAPAVVPRFAGKVIAIDVGLSGYYGGPSACLVIEQGKLWALHRKTRVEIPQDGAVRPYLEKLAALDPQPSPLRNVIEALVPAAAAVP